MVVACYVKSGSGGMSGGHRALLGGYGCVRSTCSAEARERASAWEECGVRVSEERALGHLPIGTRAWGTWQQWWGHGWCMGNTSAFHQTPGE